MGAIWDGRLKEAEKEEKGEADHVTSWDDTRKRNETAPALRRGMARQPYPDHNPPPRKVVATWQRKDQVSNGPPPGLLAVKCH